MTNNFLHHAIKFCISQKNHDIQISSDGFKCDTCRYFVIMNDKGELP